MQSIVAASAIQSMHWFPRFLFGIAKGFASLLGQTDPSLMVIDPFAGRSLNPAGPTSQSQVAIALEKLKRTLEEREHFDQANSIIGDVVELAFKEFFESTLPLNYTFHKGQINQEGRSYSGEVDLIGIRPGTRFKGLTTCGISVLPQDVQLAIECSSRLTTGADKGAKLDDELRKVRQIKSSLFVSAPRSPFNHRSEPRTIPCVIATLKGPSPKTLLDHLIRIERNIGKQFLPDLVLVLNPPYAVFPRQKAHRDSNGQLSLLPMMRTSLGELESLDHSILHLSELLQSRASRRPAAKTAAGLSHGLA